MMLFVRDQFAAVREADEGKILDWLAKR
jgi:hypothetical protein